jgi:lactate dehydrogenase-like 2-hydroxyacid dehydrogenase
LGTIAITMPKALPEKPLAYFKTGIDFLAKQPVSELTWMLSFALAREYHERGQRDRAKEYLKKANLVLQFFLSHFSSNELKNQYLSGEQRGKALATIEALTRT